MLIETYTTETGGLVSVNTKKIRVNGDYVRTFSVDGINKECWFRSIEDARDYIDAQGCRILEVHHRP